MRPTGMELRKAGFCCSAAERPAKSGSILARYRLPPGTQVMLNGLWRQAGERFIVSALSSALPSLDTGRLHPLSSP